MDAVVDVGSERMCVLSVRFANRGFKPLTCGFVKVRSPGRLLQMERPFQFTIFFSFYHEKSFSITARGDVTVL